MPPGVITAGSRREGGLLFTGFPLLVLLLAAPADVRPQEDVESFAALEEVIVTGTRIPRRDYASPSPVSTLDQLTIEFSGQPTLEEALNQMPQVQPDFGRSSNNPGDGTSRLNLRGLGAERTLVMLNGRRLAPSAARRPSMGPTRSRGWSISSRCRISRE
jgi:outer membrane cobalamin receptor